VHQLIGSVPDGTVAAKALKDDADFLLGGEFAAGYALDVPDELPCFCGTGLCLSGSIGYFLSHGPAPSLIDTLLPRRSRSKPLSVH